MLIGLALLAVLILCGLLLLVLPRTKVVDTAPTHYETTPEEQRNAAAHEAWLMAQAPHEGARAVPSERAAGFVKADGLARVDCVLGSDAAAALLEHIIRQLPSQEQDAASETRERERVLSAGGSASNPTRHDVPLDLDAEVVRTALSQCLSVFGGAIASVLGPLPELHELGAVVAEPGAGPSPCLTLSTGPHLPVELHAKHPCRRCPSAAASPGHEVEPLAGCMRRVCRTA